MTLPFFGGWRVPRAASASDTPEETETMVVGSAHAPSPICSVERACTAFHAAHDSIIALTEGLDEITIASCEQHLDRRDLAFQQVRAQAARTRSAWHARNSVFVAMEDWYGGENPDLADFSKELAAEAAVLFDNDCDEEGTCHRARRRPSNIDRTVPNVGPRFRNSHGQQAS